MTQRCSSGHSAKNHAWLGGQPPGWLHAGHDMLPKSNQFGFSWVGSIRPNQRIKTGPNYLFQIWSLRVDGLPEPINTHVIQQHL